MSNSDSIKAIFDEFEVSVHNARTRAIELERTLLQRQGPPANNGQEKRDLLAAEKSFLTTYDEYDGAQLERDLEDMNYLAEQSASNISLAQDPDFQYPGLVPVKYPGSLNQYLSPLFRDFIMGFKHQDKQTLAEYAVRAIIVQVVSKVLSCFCCGMPEEQDTEFRHLADLTQQREIQPIYGKWRSVLHKSLRQKYGLSDGEGDAARFPTNQETYLRTLVITAARNAYASLCLIYRINPPPAHYEQWFDAHKDTLRDLFELASKVAHRLKEDVVTKDYLPDPGFPLGSQSPSSVAPNKDMLLDVCVKLGLRYKCKQGRLDTEVTETEWKRPQFITLNRSNGSISPAKERSPSAEGSSESGPLTNKTTWFSKFGSNTSP